MTEQELVHDLLQLGWRHDLSTGRIRLISQPGESYTDPEWKILEELTPLGWHEVEALTTADGIVTWERG